MKPVSVLLIVLTVAAATAAADDPAPKLSAVTDNDRIDVLVDGDLFTTYKFARDQKYPYLYPVAGPVTGESVTTESSNPWPHHHSLFFGCDKVNGGNYWQNSNDEGQIVSAGRTVSTANNQVEIYDLCLWRKPGQEPIIRDTRRIAVSAPNQSIRIIDFEFFLEALIDVTIEKSNHSLFAARIAPALNVDNGGVLIDAEGNKGEDETFGTTSPWCDYYGTRSNVTEGLAIFQHPDNKWYPAPWFTRNYGFFSPTPMNWLEDGEFNLPQGEILHLQYRVVVHEGTTKEAGIAQLFEEYAQRAK